MAVTTIPTAGIANDAVDNTKLDLAANYAFTGTITGTPQDMVKISTTNVTSAVSSVDFETLSTDYNNFFVQVGDVEPSSNGAGLRVRLKTTGSSGYASGSSDYACARQRVYQTGGSTWSGDQGGFNANGGNVHLGQNSSGNGYVEAGTHTLVWFNNIHSTDKRKGFCSVSWGGQDSQNSAVQNIGVTFIGTGSKDAVTGIRFYFDSGNIAKGRFVIYGLKQ